MKQLGTMTKFLLVGILWTIVFLTLWRSFVYEIWGFDGAYNKHWIFLWQMWQDGWVIDTISEWCFFLAVLLFIPLWLLGWLALAQVKWGELIMRGLHYPLRQLKLFHKKHMQTRVLVITRRKSYLKVRPAPLTYVIPSVSKTKLKRKGKKGAGISKDEEKSLKERMDRLSGKKSSKKTKRADYIPMDDDFMTADMTPPFNPMLDTENEAAAGAADDTIAEFERRRNDDAPAWDMSTEEPIKPLELSPEERAEIRLKQLADIKEMLGLRGFVVEQNVVAGGITLDFAAVSEDRLVGLLIDTAEGDWLADEECFNDEDPLWFSESRRRVSPIKKIGDALAEIKTRLGMPEDTVEVRLLLIEGGNVINAADMTDAWAEMNAEVGRIGTGAPVTLPHFMEIIPEVGKKPSKTFAAECAKTLKALAGAGADEDEDLNNNEDSDNI